MSTPLYTIGTRVKVKKEWSLSKGSIMVIGAKGTIFSVSTPLSSRTASYLVNWDLSARPTTFDEDKIPKYLTILEQETPTPSPKHNKNQRFSDILKE